MEVNSSTGTKGQTIPAASAIQQELRIKAEARPVEQSGDAPKSGFDEQKLKEREKQRKPLSSEDLAAIVKDLQERLDAMGTRLNFSVDEKTESIVIQIKHKKTGELLRQIPSEEMLEIKAKLEDLLGVLFDQKV